MATTDSAGQGSIEVDLEKRGGKVFGPPNGKKMCVFLDDLSMPEVNTWGDQVGLFVCGVGGVGGYVCWCVCV
jgi:dynein heavy chain